jgi:protoporphyrinogen oxidase
MNDRNIGVLGGGLAGISFAYFSRLSVTIIEKEDRIGGLCRTFESGGMYYDIGPHIFFSKNKEILDFITGLVPMNQRKRSNKIFYKDRFVKYPFENELSALPDKDRDYCLNSFIDNPYSDYDVRNMLMFFYKTFGEGITRTYLEPYNRKIWKYEPSFMDTQMVDRIPKPPVEDVIKSAKGTATEGYLHQLHFSYPKEFGTESMIRALASLCSARTELVLSSPVEKVSIKKDGTFEVLTKGKSYGFERLVNSIPPQELLPRIEPAPPKEVMDACSKLKFNSIHITLVNTNKDNLGENFAVMVPQPDISFHRLSKIDFLGDSYHKNDTANLMVEITYRQGDQFDCSDEKINEIVVADLEKTGFSKASDTNHVKTRSFKYAYVIYDLHHRKNMDIILGWLAEKGITSIGRFGLFEYYNMDKVVETTKSIAEGFLR